MNKKKRTVVKFGEFEIGLAEDHVDFKQELLNEWNKKEKKEA